MSPRAANVRIYVDADVLGLVVGSRRHSPRWRRRGNLRAYRAIRAGSSARSGSSRAISTCCAAWPCWADTALVHMRESALQAARTLLTRRCGGQLR
jgi:hypothetical protein